LPNKPLYKMGALEPYLVELERYSKKTKNNRHFVGKKEMKRRNITID